jgi:hypothetical protein
LLLLLAAATPTLGQVSTVAGRVKVASGHAQIVRQGQTIDAKVGDNVFEGDSLRTGSDGRVGVTLKDNTRISLGPESEVELRRFAYSPADGRLAVVLRVVQGVAAYVSGRIAKLSPEAVRLETPMAIVGVRGTRLAIRVTPR